MYATLTAIYFPMVSKRREKRNEPSSHGQGSRYTTQPPRFKSPWIQIWVLTIKKHCKGFPYCIPLIKDAKNIAKVPNASMLQK
jgi:hypothetical protein